MEDSSPGVASRVQPPAANARQLHIYLSPGHDYWGKRGEGLMQNGIKALSEVECVAGMELREDRYLDYRPDFKGQVTFFDQKVVNEVRAAYNLAKLPASVFKRNLVGAGLDLRRCLGLKFRFQNVEFEGCQECKPCHWMDRAIAPGVQDYLAKQFRGGLRAKVLSGGVLRQNA